MLNQILNAGLRILFFRAGPQDFPYAPGLTTALVLCSIGLNAAVFAVTMALPLALVAAGAMVGGVALVTRAVLRARQMPNRYHQTYGALLVTSTALTVLALPALIQLAPLVKLVAQNPELMRNPEALQPPRAARIVIDLLTLWNFVVTVHIFRQATDSRLPVALLIGVVVTLTVLFIIVFAAALVAVLFGGGAAPR